jgi:hypothetical protein
MRSAKLARDPANLRVDEYSTAQGQVFSIYLAGRHFKRFTSKGETASPTWVKQGLSGESSLVSPENEKRLEEIHSRPSRYQTVRRFPRTNTDVPLCLEKAQRAYRHGRIEQTLYLFLKNTSYSASLFWWNTETFSSSSGSRPFAPIQLLLLVAHICRVEQGQRYSRPRCLSWCAARRLWQCSSRKQWHSGRTPVWDPERGR